ncbi:MAG: phosphatidate cytidylyltransferase [Atopobiaceae bacterium]|nr:phosphatidate cytidylyltransferase [Atopobiaceae bacterium]
MNNAAPEGTSKVLVRTVVGAIYAVSVVGCLYLGITATAGISTLMACMCAWELLRLLHGSGRQPNDIIALIATALYPIAPLMPQASAISLVTIGLLVACGAWYVASPRVTIHDVGMTLFVPVYCGFAFSCVTSIRACDPGIQGFLLTFGVLGSVWLNDAMAYFIGSKFGKRKLAPRISPNKSVEGFWGGLAGCMIIWTVLFILKVRNIGLLFAIPCGLAVGCTAVLGDLFESRIKRGFGVKDSGNLLPGHGGMLDRSDALIFGSMTAYFLLTLGGIV